MVKKFLFIFLFLFIFQLSAYCFEPLVFNGFIADNAHIISDENITALNQILLDLQNKTKADIAVVTLKSLNDKPIEDAALEIAREYKLGDKKLNNGAIILVAPNDKKARIEIGFGLEGIITDAKSGRILDYYMIPLFKQGEYEKGTIEGALALAYEVAEGYGVKLSFKKPLPQESEDDIDILFIILVIIILIILSKGGPSGMIFFGGPGSFGGGGSSGIRFGGGGGFGGGGASRGW